MSIFCYPTLPWDSCLEQHPARFNSMRNILAAARQRPNRCNPLVFCSYFKANTNNK